MSEQCRAMWEKLGLDMQAHDMLLQALPAIYAANTLRAPEGEAYVQND